MDEELEKQFVEGTKLIAEQRPDKIWHSYEILRLIEIIQQQGDEIQDLRDEHHEI